VQWLEVSVRVTREAAPMVESLLQAEPVLSLTLTDDQDDPVLEPGVGETPLWPSVCVTALFSGDTPAEPIAAMLSLVAGIDRPEQVSIKRFEDKQWERVWLDRFKPMKFGDKLWIVPGEEPAPAEAGHVLRLDPGLAFGTGTHPTTRLCLQWMDSHNFVGRTVVDYGCGSGVLGIVAAIKGADKVLCVDNDPQALIATRTNAIRNGVADVVRVMMPEKYEPQSADVVLANILAGPLIQLAPTLLMSLHSGGSLVMSGILQEQSTDVMNAYRNHLSGMVETIDEGWVRLAGTRITQAT
jgi:ribosomal protein L11 methyltransferase